ncbi:MAG: outer membrane protein assembly factor BamA [Nitrospirae bacterium]|nr:outer membrane protein assembly factor BamA [Nitrospirota bacterium]
MLKGGAIKKGMFSLWLINVTIIFLLFFVPAVLAQVGDSTLRDTPLVTSIEIKGNKKIEEETILEKIRSNVKEPFVYEILQKDIKALYGTGYFDDVRVDVELFEGGIKLIFILKEKPTITSVDFQGNKKIDTDELKEKLMLTPGAIANPSLITDNAEKLISFYHSEGYWHVNVIPVLREVSESAAAITFQIEEGPKVVIKEIAVEGNKAIATKEIKKAIKTKERWLFSFITGSGIYKREEMKADIERIRELYHSRGYIYVVVSEPEVTLSPDKTKLYIKTSISEGEQYRVGEVKITGNTIFSSSELYKQIETTKGKVFSRAELGNSIDKIIDLYMERGYARADINPIIDTDTEKKLANITLSITEGDMFRIGRIEITGNTKTRDKVIRREMRLDEGDIFNKKLLKRSYQRIANLNYFESVDLTPEPHIDEKLIDVNVRVKEKLTGMLSIGGGYSSVDKFMVMGEIQQANLFGKGLYLKFRADFSSRRKNYTLTLRDPWFMDKPISASFSIYNEVFQYPDYDKDSSGASIGFGKEITEYVGANVIYNFEQVEISNVSATASSLIKEQVGKKTTSSISPSIWKDTRDNYLDPTTGSRHAIYTTFAGLGGDNYFVKGVVDSSWYLPAIWNTTFGLRGRFGYATGFAGKEIPLYERFYVGGINTVRGLGFGEGGPRNAEDEKIGGNKELIFNAEYIFPIEKDIKLKGVLFLDAGRAFDNTENLSIAELRRTAGFGFRWMSPIGPIRLEWGFNLSPKYNEAGTKLEFTFGGLF